MQKSKLINILYIKAKEIKYLKVKQYQCLLKILKKKCHKHINKNIKCTNKFIYAYQCIYVYSLQYSCIFDTT